MKWERGIMPVVWDDAYKGFNYKRQPIVGEMADEWIRQGYTHEETSGLMYGGENIMPDWVFSCANFLEYKNPAFSFYRMDQMNIMPRHQDHYKKYIELFGGKKENIKRTIIFLEDWKFGHYFEIARTGVSRWVAGSYFSWDHDVIHSAANIGTEPRYTLQITGIK